MKHIAIFTQNLTFGGVQKSVVNLANFLVKYYKVSIILAEDNKPIKYKLNKKIKIYSIKTKKIDITKKYAGLKIFKYRIKELEKILNKIKPNIALGFEDYNNFILYNAKTKFKIEKIYSVRNIFSRYESKKFHLLSVSFYYKNIKIYNKSKVIVVSKTIKKEILKAKLIYNGIENKKDLPNLYKNYILNIGRLHPQKGQIDLIKAFTLIKNKISQNLIIVGDGPLKNELKKLIQKLNLEDRIKLVGFDNPYKYYKNASLFVFPSYYEGFSNTILEAMKKNLPIIAYDYIGSEEILKERIELGNIKSLANAILKAINDKEYREKLLEQNEIVKNFFLHKTLRKFKRVIDVWNSWK